MTGRHGRSVGELLLDADHTARDLLIDAPDLDAAVVLRTWGEVVQTADDLCAALPAPPAAAGALALGGARPDVMAQLVVMTDALTRGLRAGPWPGPGVTEPRLQHVANTFARAAQLVHAHAARSMSNHPRVRANADAARTRIIHTLYVTSHAVRLPVAAHVRHREQVQSARGRTSTAGTLAVARPVLARLDAFERVAGAYVARTFPAALNGEHREAIHSPRVGDALADRQLLTQRLPLGRGASGSRVVEGDPRHMVGDAQGVAQRAVDPSEWSSRQVCRDIHARWSHWRL
jgi:hypothetical protein